MGMYDWEEFHNYEHEDAYADEEAQTTTCECTIVHETEKAYLLNIKKVNKEGWFPKSEVTIMTPSTFEIPNWLLLKFKRSL